MITRTHSTLLQTSKAIFSDDEKYRYSLERVWNVNAPRICFLMMNPSTATEVDNDPTIERCQRRAVALGYGGIVIVNIFPYRMTDSRQLKTVSNLVGDEQTANDMISDAVERCAITICGWDKHNNLIFPRVNIVFAMLKERGLDHKLHALKVNDDGSPQHPLYIAYSQQPIAWRFPEVKP